MGNNLEETSPAHWSRRARASSPRTRASGTIKKRFDSIGVESTEENRRAYRDLLFTTEGAEDYISGVILYDETIRQIVRGRHAVPEAARERGIIPGIKVDMGAKPLANAPGETITEGLDGLRERLAEYRELGARFAKWRARDLDRRRHPERVLHLDERARARPLRARCARRPASCRSSSPRC